MNINLDGNYPTDPDTEQPETWTTQIEEHIATLRASGFKVTPEHILVAEGPNYPGSYQVWVVDEDGNWLYVTPDGVVVASEAVLPRWGDI